MRLAIGVISIAFVLDRRSGTGWDGPVEKPGASQRSPGGFALRPSRKLRQPCRALPVPGLCDAAVSGATNICGTATIFFAAVNLLGLTSSGLFNLGQCIRLGDRFAVLSTFAGVWLVRGICATLYTSIVALTFLIGASCTYDAVRVLVEGEGYGTGACDFIPRPNRSERKRPMNASQVRRPVRKAHAPAMPAFAAIGVVGYFVDAGIT